MVKPNRILKNREVAFCRHTDIKDSQNPPFPEKIVSLFYFNMDVPEWFGVVGSSEITKKRSNNIKRELGT